MILAIIGFSAIVVLTQLQSNQPFAAGTIQANQTTSVLSNITGGVESFFGNAGTWFALLAIVIIILIVVIVMKSVNNISNKGGSGSL